MSYYYDLAEPSLPRKKVDPEKKNFLINATADWIIKQVRNNLVGSSYTMELLHFRAQLVAAMNDRFDRLGCVNLRTTAPDSYLILLAANCNIPVDALPRGISIVVTYTSAYYYEYHCATRYAIAS